MEQITAALNVEECFIYYTDIFWLVEIGTALINFSCFVLFTFRSEEMSAAEFYKVALLGFLEAS